jgi:hypothetical protein
VPSSSIHGGQKMDLRLQAKRLPGHRAKSATGFDSLLRFGQSCPVAGIAHENGILRRRRHGTAKDRPQGLDREAKLEEDGELVRAWKRQTRFREPRLQIFFDALLGKEADSIATRLLARSQCFASAVVIGLRLCYPLSGHRPHRA